MYEEDDVVDLGLLCRLGKWIMYNKLPQLALHLGFNMAEISRIMTPTRNPEEQIFQVSIITAHHRSSGKVVCSVVFVST